jgi:hypothetical protein
VERCTTSAPRSGTLLRGIRLGNAYLIAESIDRGLKPQVVGTTKDGEVITRAVPPSGPMLSAWLRGMTALLVTEGDRRRAQLEHVRPSVGGDADDHSCIDEYRRRLQPRRDAVRSKPLSANPNA